jgi:hypothetical protein
MQGGSGPLLPTLQGHGDHVMPSTESLLLPQAAEIRHVQVCFFACEEVRHSIFIGEDTRLPSLFHFMQARSTTLWNLAAGNNARRPWSAHVT